MEEQALDHSGLRIERRWNPLLVGAAGVFAGVNMIGFLMTVSGINDGARNFFTPLRMIVRIFDENAFHSDYPILNLLVFGMAIHIILSVFFGYIIAFMLTLIPRVWWRSVLPSALGSLFGAGLWFINYNLIGPSLGMTWFTKGVDQLPIFLAHAAVYGGCFGWVLTIMTPAPKVQPLE